jgi:hypothetical protein
MAHPAPMLACTARGLSLLQPYRFVACGQAAEQRPDLGERDRVIHSDFPNSAEGHGRVECFFGALHNGDSAAALDFLQPRHPIVQRSRENDSHYPLSISRSRRTEGNVDARAHMMFLRAHAGMDLPTLDYQMAVGRGDVNVPVLNMHWTCDCHRGQWAGPGNNCRQHASEVWIDVDHHKDCGFERGGELRGQLLDRVNSPHGSADGDYVVFGNTPSLFMWGHPL